MSFPVWSGSISHCLARIQKQCTSVTGTFWHVPVCSFYYKSFIHRAHTRRLLNKFRMLNEVVSLGNLLLHHVITVILGRWKKNVGFGYERPTSEKGISCTSTHDTILWKNCSSSLGIRRRANIGKYGRRWRRCRKWIEWWWTLLVK